VTVLVDIFGNPYIWRLSKAPPPTKTTPDDYPKWQVTNRAPAAARPSQVEKEVGRGTSEGRLGG